jgi:hypothetical protein
VVLIVAAAAAIAGGVAGAAPRHARLSGAEREFVRSYEALVPNLNRVSAAIVTAVRSAGKQTDARIVTVFSSLAGNWTAATKPLLALHAPAPEAGVFAAVTARVPAIETDLLATAQAGRTHSATAAATAARNLVRDFNALGTAVLALKKRLGLPLNSA